MRPTGRKAGLWPRVPAASGQEGLSSSPQGHLGLCLFPAQASSKRHLSLQVGAGCLRCSESRRGGSRLGRQVTLLCVGQSLPASPQDFTTTCCPAGAGVPASLGSPQAGACLSFTHRQGPPLPSVPSGFVLWTLSLPQKRGAGSALRGCWTAAAVLLLPQDWPPRAGKLARACPWPSETIPSDCAKGWGYDLGSPGSTGPSQPPSLQLV